MLGSVIRNICILVAVMVVAVVVLREWTAAPPPAGDSVVKTEVPAGQPVSGNPNEFMVQAGPGGHFVVDATVGFRDIRFIVDTGATMVALSPQDADTLGFYVHQLDYSGRAQTANGVARFAPVIIEEIRIGDIVVRDVQAAVIEGPMRRSLLGMTFLRKLAGFEVKGDRLILRW